MCTGKDAGGEVNSTWAQVKDAVAHVREQFEAIRAKYKPLGPYMVFASPYGQESVETEPAVILEVFPWMIADGEAKVKAQGIMDQLHSMAGDVRTGKGSRRDLETELERRLANVTFRGDVNIELRFRDLDYPLIWQLQQDPLIDRELTPQTKASIRIVLTNLDRTWQEMRQKTNLPRTR
jgi:hypothetical protein